MPLEQLRSWLQAHQGEYIAYPVTKQGVAGVLSSGYVKTAEQQIREIKSLSKEQVAKADKVTKDISNFIEQLKKDGTVFAPVVRVVTNACIDFTHAMQLEAVDEQVYSLLFKDRPSQRTHILPNGKVIELQDKRKGNPIHAYDVILTDIPWGEVDANNTSRLKYSLYEQIAIDSLADEPVDMRLSKIWEACKTVFSKPRLFTDLCALREKEIPYSRHGKELCARFNQVAWDDGDVFILRGQPLKLLSFSNQMQHRIDFQPKPGYFPAAGDLVKLLCPFENKGEAFSLALAEEHTIVLGLEATLAPYMSLMQERNIAFCTIESMKPEHFNALSASSDSSCSSGSQSPSEVQDRLQEALKTMTLFAQKPLRAAFLRWKEVKQKKLSH